MTATPDTPLLTGQTLRQVRSDEILVTPTGGSQTTLANALGNVRFRSVAVSSAQLLAANSTPVEIVPAPGANQLLSVLNSYYVFTHGATPYTGGPGQLFYGAPSHNLHCDVGDSNVATATVDHIAQGGANGAANQLESATSNLANQAVNYSANTAYIDGTGTMLIGVFYSVFDITHVTP